MVDNLFGRELEERFFRILGLMSISVIILSFLIIILTVVVKGLPAMNIEMITQSPKGGFYLGKEGGILNAILGSLYLAAGSTILAFIISLPTALFLQKEYFGGTRLAGIVRLSLDILWGIPSIVYGAFGFIIMLYLGLRASLLGGIIALTLVIIPVMTRTMDEVFMTIPKDLREVSYAVGATRLETTFHVILKQALPGIMTGVILAFGRGIGDAASILFTAGYTDNMPSSLFDPVASLPLAIFFQLGTPYPKVQERAYASALILLVIVFALTVSARLLSKKFEKNIIR